MRGGSTVVAKKWNEKETCKMRKDGGLEFEMMRKISKRCTL